MKTITELTSAWQVEDKNLIAQSCMIVNTYMAQLHVTSECAYIRYLKHTGLFFIVLKHLSTAKTRNMFLDLDTKIIEVDLELDNKRLAIYKSWKKNEFSDKVIAIQDRMLAGHALSDRDLYMLNLMRDYIPYNFNNRDEIKISLGIKRRN